MQPVFYHSGNIAALFLNDTLEVDVAIAKESMLGIFGSGKVSSRPMTEEEHVFAKGDH